MKKRNGIDISYDVISNRLAGGKFAGDQKGLPAVLCRGGQEMSGASGNAAPRHYPARPGREAPLSPFHDAAAETDRRAVRAAGAGETVS